MGGGTRLAAMAGSGLVGVVDLQAAGLGGIEHCDDGKVLIGATTTLEDLANSLDVPEAVREAARRERPSSLRTLSTVGGCVATAELESELLATFLVYRASVRTADSSGAYAAPLGDLLADPGGRTTRSSPTLRSRPAATSPPRRAARTPSDT